MRRTKYIPKTVKGKVHSTGWAIDGYTLVLTLWDYDNYESYHLRSWPKEADIAVMETMFETETAAGMCLYDTLEEFAGHWEEWEPEGAFCIPKDKVEVLEVIQEERKVTMTGKE